MTTDAMLPDPDWDALRVLLGEFFQPMRDPVATLNRVREIVAEFSPFTREPVDLVRWVPV